MHAAIELLVDRRLGFARKRGEFRIRDSNLCDRKQRRQGLIDAENRSYYVVSENQEGVESKKIIPQNAEGKIIRTESERNTDLHFVSREHRSSQHAAGEAVSIFLLE